MTSSLARQLAQGVSLNVSQLVEKSRRNPTESYLFTGRDADQHDLDTVFSLASNALLRLKTIEPALAFLEDSLFSDAAKSVDRTLLPSDANQMLNESIKSCLRLLGPYLMDAPTGKILEWLVRRFRIHEFNVEDILRVFLPYHESPHFTKMASILRIQKQSTWDFLLPFKSAGRAIPRLSLVQEMLRNSDVARFISSLLPESIKDGHVHRTLIVFHAATLHDYITSSQSLNEGTVAFLLPAILQPLQAQNGKYGSKDCILSSYVLLAALTRKCRLAPKALKVIVDTMTKCAHFVSTSQFLSAIIAFCGSQAELDSFSESTLSAFIRLPNVQVEFCKNLDLPNVDHFVMPILVGISSNINNPSHIELMEAVAAAPNALQSLLVRYTTYLINAAISPDSVVAPYRRLLASIQQRHPDAFQEATRAAISGGADQKAVEALIMQLSLPLLHHGRKGRKRVMEVESLQDKDVELIIAATNADDNVRAIAARDLLASIQAAVADESASTVQDSILTTIMALISDTSPQVIEALYSAPSGLLSVVSADVKGFLKTILSTITTVKQKSIVLAHLTFIADHLSPLYPEHAYLMLECFLPFLLFTELSYVSINDKDKGNSYAMSRAVWEIIAASDKVEGQVGKYELLMGCVDAWQWEEGSQVPESVESVDRLGWKLAKMNAAVAVRVAENIAGSNNFQAHLNWLLGAVESNHKNAQNFVYIVLRSLLSRISSENQADIALRVLRVMHLEDLEIISDFMEDNDNLQELLEDSNLMRNLVRRPGQKKTLHWLQASILGQLPLIARPNGVVINWFSGEQSQSVLFDSSSDTRGVCYVALMRKLYTLANTSAKLTALAVRLMQGMFISLRDDTLAFLAGLWTYLEEKPSASTEGAGWLPAVALRHATAFFTSFIDYSENKTTHDKHLVDFQTVLPALLVALQSKQLQTREAATECLHALSVTTEREQAKKVYYYDAIYGSGSEKLQYLEWSDFGTYVQSMVQCREHILNDGEYVQVFHQETLNALSKKSEKRYKRAIVCYLASHSDVLSLPGAKNCLLKILKNVSDSSKAKTLISSIQASASPASVKTVSDQLGVYYADYTSLLVSSLDKSIIDLLNDDKGEMWDTYISVIKYFFKSGSPSAARNAVMQSLAKDIFPKLDLPRQIEFCETVLDLGLTDADTYDFCKSALTKIIQTQSLIIALLNASQIPLTGEASPRAPKRAKLDEAPNDDIEPPSTARMTLLCEILASISMPSSVELLARLMDLLQKLVQNSLVNKSDSNYLQQLLMSAIENTADKIKHAPNLLPSSVRLDPLVELIRVSENPQTFNQALLLIANLSRLTPDSIIHNIMPIFTFMGSHVFHRDDSYSFKVVQKTIDSIVPVMASSIIKSHAEPLQRYINARDFLRVFTDAANHVPKHRRSKLFTYLVEVLGPKDFCAPVCMLLVERVAKQVSKRGANDINSQLALSLSVLEVLPIEDRLMVLISILNESERLLARLANPEANVIPFLVSRTEEAQIRTPSHIKLRAEALIIYASYAVQDKSFTLTNDATDTSKTLLKELITILVGLSSVISKDNSADIANAASDALKNVLNIIHAADFLEISASMLEADNSKTKASVLDLLAQRIPNITDETRTKASATMSRIIAACRKICDAQTQSLLSLVSSAFSAIKIIAETVVTGEESAMTSLLPTVISALKQKQMASKAVAVLPALPGKLGPRIIPHFREIVDQVVPLFETYVDTNDSSGLDNCVSTFQALLVAIPTFWGARELKKMIQLTINHSSARGISNVTKSLAKRVPPKTLIPTLVDMWANIQSLHDRASEKYIGYFEIFKRSLKAATQAVVLEHLRSLTKLFMEAFDLPPAPSYNPSLVDAAPIRAFLELTVKLNDTAFKPLFRRLYDWAFNEEALSHRVVTFLHVYCELLGYFKRLMTPYMSFLFNKIIELLKSQSNGIEQPELWACIVGTLKMTLDEDENTFWREDKLKAITAPLISQVPACSYATVEGGVKLLSDTFIALVGSVSDDALLKSINLDILMHTRSEETRVCIHALNCSEAIWRSHGNKFLGYVTETATFIAEAAESPNESVVRASIKLKKAVEDVAGSIGDL